MNFEFDDILCAPRRLGILATLVPGEPVSFTEMKTMTKLSDGNLHVQSRKLADAGYIEITKTRKGRRSVTHFRITGSGRRQLRAHVKKLQEILDAEGGKVSDIVTKPAQKAKPAHNTGSSPGKRRMKRDDSAVWA